MPQGVKWAYPEFYDLTRLVTEDLEHGRIYGTVRIVNPFRAVDPT